MITLSLFILLVVLVASLLKRPQNGTANPASENHTTAKYNPTTGLPMVGEMFDIQGNLYGVSRRRRD